MANRKLVFKNRPSVDDYGIYTYLEGSTSVEHADSDSVPVQFDKFAGKDLSTNSINNEVNNAIMDSVIQNTNSSTGNIDRLRYIGNSFVQINSLMVYNRGVNSNVNDVFFRVHIWTKEYCAARSDNGSWKSYSSLKSCCTKFLVSSS